MTNKNREPNALYQSSASLPPDSVASRIFEGVSPKLLGKTVYTLLTNGYISEDQQEFSAIYTTQLDSPQRIKRFEEHLSKALKDYQHFHQFTIFDITESQSYQPTGTLDAATQILLDYPRCGLPDKPLTSPFPPTATPDVAGTGSWPVGCHTPGIHEIVVHVHPSGMPTRLRPIFQDALDLVEEAYKKVGLKLTFVNVPPPTSVGQGFTPDTSFLPLTTSSIQIDFRFERLRGSTIGLAQIPSRPTCRTRIWCKYDPTYLPTDLINQWARLIAHEIGHNVILYHTRGGVMNSSILRGTFTPDEWIGDPSESTLRRFFGIPIDPPVSPTFSSALVLAPSGIYTTNSSSSTSASLTTHSKTYKGKVTKL